MRLEDIEEGERLLAEVEGDHPDQTGLMAWLLDNAPALIAAAKAAASESARADKAEAELAETRAIYVQQEVRHAREVRKITDMQAELAALREAAGPFVQIHADADIPDETRVYPMRQGPPHYYFDRPVGFEYTVGHLRALARAVKGEG